MRTRSQHAAEQQQQQKKDKLPDDLWRKILESVDDNGVMAFASVCKQLRRVQRESGRRLRTELKRFPRVYERGFLEKLTSRMSTKSEDWCLWSMRVLPSPDEEKKRKRIIDAAAFWGHLNLLKEWRKQRKESIWRFGENLCDFAASGGHVKVLMWLFDLRLFDEVEEFEVCNIAALCGHLEVIKFFEEKNLHWDVEDVCHLASIGGHSHVVEYAREKLVFDDESCFRAAFSGNLDMLKVSSRYIFSFFPKKTSPLTPFILKYLHERGCPWDDEVTARAAKHGDVEMLKYAIENGCPYGAYTYAKAQVNMIQEVLDYLDSINCDRFSDDEFDDEDDFDLDE